MGMGYSSGWEDSGCSCHSGSRCSFGNMEQLRLKQMDDKIDALLEAVSALTKLLEAAIQEDRGEVS